MIQRGKKEEAKAILKKIRGTENVEDELKDLIEASEASEQAADPWKSILQRQHRPQLVITTLIPIFQQLTGINVIMFYAPVLFKTLGFGDDAALMSAVVTGLVNVFATLVSVFTVDRFGRRALFLEGGIQMILSQIGVGVLIYNVFGEGAFSKGMGNVAMALICVVVGGGWCRARSIRWRRDRRDNQSMFP